MKLVPSYTMIFACGAVLLPAALVAIYVPGAQTVMLSLVLMFGIVVVLDAAGAYGSLNAVRASVPAITRATRGVDTSLEITLFYPKMAKGRLALGLQFPAAIDVEQDTLLVSIPADAEQALVSWNCIPVERGNFPFTQLFIGISSPWKFWEHHRAVPIDGTLRVYPNVMNERKNLASIFLNRDAMGIHSQRLMGKGRDFAQLRDYLPGDSYEDIHWKATARAGRPVTKMYQVERTQEVYVLIDSSCLSAVKQENPEDGSRSTNLERCINAALILGMVAEKQGDLFGLITFDEKVQKFLKARNGHAHFNTCRDAIYATEPSKHHPDYAELFSFIRLNLRKRALMIVLTNLSDPLLAESFTEHVDLITRNHLILVNMIADPAVEPLFSGEPVETTENIYERVGGHVEWHNLQATRQKLHLRNVSLQILSHDTFSADLVSQYMTLKQRQRL